MSRNAARKARIANYQREKEIETRNEKNADGSEYVWRFNNRIEICEPFIRDSADFASVLGCLTKTPSPFDEGEVVLQCLDGDCNSNIVKSWIFNHLYNYVVQQANAIFVLIENSFIQNGLQLWRSLFEASVICEFLAENQEQYPNLCQDYITHSMFLMWIRHKKDYNTYWQKKGNEPYYDASVISKMESELTRKFGKKYRANYSWTRPSFGKLLPFGTMLDRIDGNEQLSFFYNLSSKEIHPTLGHRFLSLGFVLPPPIVPMLPCGEGHMFRNYNEMLLDYITVKVLLRITKRAKDFLALDDEMQQRSDSLVLTGEQVLERLDLQYRNRKCE